jgi:hypothetical protein
MKVLVIIICVVGILSLVLPMVVGVAAAIIDKLSNK